MKELGITLDKDNTDQQIKHVREDPDKKSLKGQFKKLFNENHTVKGIEQNPTKRRCKTDTAEGEANTDSFTTIG